MHGFRICGFSDLKLSGTPPEGGTLGLTTPRGMLSPRVPPGWVRGKQGGGRCSFLDRTGIIAYLLERGTCPHASGCDRCCESLRISFELILGKLGTDLEMISTTEGT